MSSSVGRQSLLWGTDVALFVAFLGTLVLGYQTVGAAGPIAGSIHALLAGTVLAGILYHLALHWSWVVRTARRPFRGLGNRSRSKLVLDIILGLTFVFIFVSGLVIFLGAQGSSPTAGFDSGWVAGHHVGNKLLLVLISAHLVLNRRWIRTKLFGSKSGDRREEEELRTGECLK